jgi:hypothetical protein
MAAFNNDFIHQIPSFCHAKAKFFNTPKITKNTKKKSASLMLWGQRFWKFIDE